MTESMSFFALVKADFARYLKDVEKRARPKAVLALLLFHPGAQLAVSLRLQRQLKRLPLLGKFFERVIWYASTVMTGSDINREARIGPGIYLPHPTGVVIRSECEIGRDVTILQGVTIGRGENDEISKTVIGDGARIYAGAKIIGNVTIGAGATIGANAVVLKDVPAGAVAVGVPARLIRNGGAAA